MNDDEAIGAVIDEMYAMISGPAGPRDWSRQDNCVDLARSCYLCANERWDDERRA